jgi:hypothetical protein
MRSHFLAFSNGAHDDQVDAGSPALNYQRGSSGVRRGSAASESWRRVCSLFPKRRNLLVGDVKEAALPFEAKAEGIAPPSTPLPMPSCPVSQAVLAVRHTIQRGQLNGNGELYEATRMRSVV